MKTYTLNGFEIAVPDIPEGAVIRAVHFGRTMEINSNYDDEKESYNDEDYIDLPPGDWQLLKLSEVPESLADKIVEKHRNLTYKCYDNKSYDMMTAHASLTSFLRANGVEGNPYLLIKKN